MGRHPASPPTHPARAAARGRQARHPSEIPVRGWRDVLWRVWLGVERDSLLMVARSIAFSVVMALLPGLAAFVALYGLFADPAAAREHLALLAGVVPGAALALIGDEMVRIATEAEATLSLTFLLGLSLAFWTANTGMRALIRGLNIAYGERESRGFLRLTLTSGALTLGAFGFLLATVAALLVLPLVLGVLGVPADLGPLGLLRWPALLLLAVAAFEVLYRLGPDRRPARWRWLSVGAVAAAGLWLVGSLALSAYVAGFAGYAATYGSLGAVFGCLIWSWISAVVVLLGAKLNAELEHQTEVDTTVGPDRPMGSRGAAMADAVGPPAPAARPGWWVAIRGSIARLGLGQRP